MKTDLTKETWFSLHRECMSWEPQSQSFPIGPGSVRMTLKSQDLGSRQRSSLRNLGGGQIQFYVSVLGL